MVIALALAITPTASAATEFGDNCVANKVNGPIPVAVTLVARTAVGDPLPLAAPSAGVITRWKLDQGPAEATTVPLTLRVLRPTGLSAFQVVGESPQIITAGLNSFETRIPVQTGDRLALGVAASVPLVYCQTSPPPSQYSLFPTTGGVGSTEVVKPESELESQARVPVAAIIEPDADNDGYGDETQDKCPQNAATHDACPSPPVPPPVPPVTLGAAANARSALVKILVTSNAQAPVNVVGSVRLGKRKSARLSGGMRIVAPGTLAQFVLPFPKALTARLAALSSKRSLSLRVTVTAPNAAGVITSKELTVKLKGRAKPELRKR